MKERAFAEAAAGASGRRDRLHLSRGQASPIPASCSPFRPGLQRILEQAPGAGRADGAARTLGQFLQPFRSGHARCARLRGLFSRIALVAGPPVRAGARDAGIPAAERARLAR